MHRNFFLSFIIVLTLATLSGCASNSEHAKNCKLAASIDKVITVRGVWHNYTWISLDDYPDCHIQIESVVAGAGGTVKQSTRYVGWENLKFSNHNKDWKVNTVNVVPIPEPVWIDRYHKFNAMKLENDDHVIATGRLSYFTQKYIDWGFFGGQPAFSIPDDHYFFSYYDLKVVKSPSSSHKLH